MVVSDLFIALFLTERWTNGQQSDPCFYHSKLRDAITRYGTLKDENEIVTYELIDYQIWRNSFDSHLIDYIPIVDSEQVEIDERKWSLNM